MPTPCRRSGRRMGSAHILDLCSFPSLSSIQIHRIELSCCLPFFQHLLFESKLWVHTVVHCYTLSFTFCCMFCINLLSSYDSSLSPTTCVLLVSHLLFVCFISGSHIKLPSQYFKYGRMGLLNTCHPLKSSVEVEKSVLQLRMPPCCCCAFEELSERKLSR